MEKFAFIKKATLRNSEKYILNDTMRTNGAMYSKTKYFENFP